MYKAQNKKLQEDIQASKAIMRELTLEQEEFKFSNSMLKSTILNIFKTQGKYFDKLYSLYKSQEFTKITQWFDEETRYKDQQLYDLQMDQDLLVEHLKFILQRPIQMYDKIVTSSRILELLEIDIENLEIWKNNLGTLFSMSKEKVKKKAKKLAKEPQKEIEEQSKDFDRKKRRKALKPKDMWGSQIPNTIQENIEKEDKTKEEQQIQEESDQPEEDQEKDQQNQLLQIFIKPSKSSLQINQDYYEPEDYDYVKSKMKIKTQESETQTENVVIINQNQMEEFSTLLQQYSMTAITLENQHIEQEKEDLEKNQNFQFSSIFIQPDLLLQIRKSPIKQIKNLTTSRSSSEQEIQFQTSRISREKSSQSPQKKATHSEHQPLFFNLQDLNGQSPRESSQQT